MVAKRIDDVPDLRPRPSPWGYLGLMMLGGAVAFWAFVFLVGGGSDGGSAGAVFLMLLGGMFLTLYGLGGLVGSLVRRRSRD